MRILKDFKIPNFKFPKFKMEGLEKIDEMNVEYDPTKQVEVKRDKRNFEPTTYKTIKEIFNRSTKLFADRPFIIEKFNHKDEAFTEITYASSVCFNIREAMVVPWPFESEPSSPSSDIFSFARSEPVSMIAIFVLASGLILASLPVR